MSIETAYHHLLRYDERGFVIINKTECKKIFDHLKEKCHPISTKFYDKREFFSDCDFSFECTHLKSLFNIKCSNNFYPE